jgi:hypothetical protein
VTENDIDRVAKENKFTRISKYIIMRCGFPEDAKVVEVITQQGWMESENVTTITFEEIKNFWLVSDIGM